MTFSVAAAGDGPLSYQWQRAGADVPGATGTSYTLGNAQLDSNGSVWTARVTNPAGSVLSASATLSVVGAPVEGTVTLLAGDLAQSGALDGAGGAARFNLPQGLAVDASGNVLVADSMNHTIRKVQPDGVVSTLAGGSGQRGTADGFAGAARFTRPIGVTIDAEGTLYVMDGWELMPFSLRWHSIRTVSPLGEVRTAYSLLPGEFGSSGKPLMSPPGLAVGPGGDVYAAAQQGLWRIGRTGSPVLLETGLPQNLFTTAVARDAAGSLYFTQGNSIQKRSVEGVVTVFAGSITEAGSADGTGTSARFGFDSPGSGSADVPAFLAFDASGNLFVSDARNHTVRKISPAGVVTTVAGKAGVATTVPGALADASLARPQGIAVVSEKLLYVVSGHAVLKLQLP